MKTRACVATLLATCFVVFGTAVAQAQPTGSDGTVAPNLDGPCTVSATINETGTTIDPAASGGVYSAPLSGSASYNGAIDVDPGEGRAVSGRVWVVTPPGIPSFTLKSWEDDDAENVGDAGTVSWDLPDVLPRGIKVTVEGVHNDQQNCTGSITVKIDGGLLDSATGIGSLIRTVVAGGGLVFAGVPRR